jgi:hypothetical protein
LATRFAAGHTLRWMAQNCSPTSELGIETKGENDKELCAGMFPHFDVESYGH